MSIGRRFINLARSELNSLLDRAASADDDDDAPRDAWGGGGLEDLSDEELVAELERRKRARQEAEQAAKPRAGAARGTSSRASAGRPASRAPVDEIARAYAALEVPPGSSFETVRKAYRNLMRKYHPDHHTGTPEKQKAANELAQKLTDAYKLLEKRLRK